MYPQCKDAVRTKRSQAGTKSHALVQVHRFPGAVYKSFLTRREADDWIARQEAVYNGRSSSHESKNQEAQPVARPSGEFGDDFIRLEPGVPEDLLTTGDAISRRTSSIAKG